MRIDLFNSTPGQLSSEASAPQAAAQTAAHSSQAGGEDRTTLTSDTVSLSSLVSAALNSPEVRQDKVDSLRHAVGSGQYELAPAKIAASMVDDYA